MYHYTGYKNQNICIIYVYIHVRIMRIYVYNVNIVFHSSSYTFTKLKNLIVPNPLQLVNLIFLMIPTLILYTYIETHGIPKYNTCMCFHRLVFPKLVTRMEHVTEADRNPLL